MDDVMRPLLLMISAGLAMAQPLEKPFGLTARVPWTTSRLVGSPDPPSPYRLTRAFPQVTFKGPVFIAQDPLSDRFFVAEYDGLIYSFQPKDATGKKDLFLDLGRGISAFSFHPRYKENGFVFVFSHNEVKPGDQKGLMSRIYRYQLEPGSQPPRLRPGLTDAHHRMAGGRAQRRGSDHWAGWLPVRLDRGRQQWFGRQRVRAESYRSALGDDAARC